MERDPELLRELADAAGEADRLRTRAGELLRNAVGKAAAHGLTQKEIALAVGRSQPEVSRLLKNFESGRFRPRSAAGRCLVRHRDEVIELAEAHRAHFVRVFGSVGRGDDDESSDIDLLVDLDLSADLYDLAALRVELERLLKRPVDVLPERMLRADAESTALDEAVPL